MSVRTLNKVIAASLGLGLSLLAVAGPAPAPRYVVQAGSTGQAERAVLRVGGVVVADLEVINAVGAELSAAQAGELRGKSGLRLYADVAVKVSGTRTTTTSTTTTTTTDFTRTTSSDGQLSLAELQRSFMDGADYTHPALVGAPEVCTRPHHRQGRAIISGSPHHAGGGPGGYRLLVVARALRAAAIRASPAGRHGRTFTARE